MAIGLVVYFGYSYTHSHLATEGIVDDVLPTDYKPPIAAMVGIVLVLALTVYQVLSPSSMLGMGLDPAKHLADNTAINLAIRLFAWALTGALVYMLLYGRGSTGRKASTRNIGLGLSAVNIVLWVGITAWYFMSIHGK
jgi:hypothetical protein